MNCSKMEGTGSDTVRAETELKVMKFQVSVHMFCHYWLNELCNYHSDFYNV